MVLERADGSSTGSIPGLIAAIDIGTNSVHMVIARVAGNDRFEVVTRQKEMVRLGSGQGEMKQLEPDAIERGVQALTRCKSLADSWGAEVHAVATSAVREARNAQDFLVRARVEAGVVVDVISGQEEARLIHLGVLQALPVFEKRLLVVDVGGGSTEIVFGTGLDIDQPRSLKIGSLRMTRRFFPDGQVTPLALERCRRFVHEQVTGMAREVADLQHDVAVASSGTAETLAGMVLARRGESIPQSMNGATVSTAELSELVDRLAALPPDQRRTIPGMDPARVDIIVGGGVVLEQTLLALGASSFKISDYALREGVLLNALIKDSQDPRRQLSDLRRASVFHLMELCDDDPDHSLNVARLALQLADAIGERLGLDAEARELLEAGALLANTGLFVAHSGHHKHSYYVIRHSDHLMGFTDLEIELIAQIARYHRKSPPSDTKHSEFAALSDPDRATVRRAAAVLRVAIGLDRNHDGAVGGLTLSVGIGEEPLWISVEPQLQDDGTVPDLSLECWSANERTGLLAEVLGVAIQVTSALPS